MLANEIIERARDLGCTAELTATTVDKGNGVKMNAITVRKAHSIIGANVYYGDDEPIDAIVERVLKVSKQEVPEFDLGMLTDFEKAKEHLFVTLYSQLPEHVVGKQMIGDLYVVPTILMDEDDDNFGSVKITKQLLDGYGISLDELIDVAIESAKRIFPASVRTMYDTIKEMVGGDLDDDMLDIVAPGPNFLVVTNNPKVNGAGAILYADGLPSEFYMLPSSRHEVLIVPMEMAHDEQTLVDMVREVNATQVAPKDRLSDNAYYYNNGEWRVIA